MSEENSIDFFIRSARNSDIPDITRLNAQLGYADNAAVVAHRFRRLSRDRRNNAVFVAEAGPSAAASGGSVIGWIHVLVDKLITVGPRGVIGGLVVDEKWRSRGVGAALARRAEQWVESKELGTVVVHTNVVRTRAHRFYERCGYELLKHSKVYTKVIGDSGD